jgi:histidyl-tRNA synthetase
VESGRGDGAARLPRYHYQEIRTPILEPTELFARGVGEETDIVSKEMYTFQDRDGSFADPAPGSHRLRDPRLPRAPAGPAPGLQKLYYIGPMFRRERPQKGPLSAVLPDRGRGDRLGIPAVDAEVIEMVVELLGEVGLENFQLLLNSVGCPECRPAYVERLREELRGGEGAVRGLPASPGNQPAAGAGLQGPGRSARHRFPALDPRTPLPRLPGALRGLGRMLEARGIRFRPAPRLVRGLDYYMRTTFEVLHGALGAQNSVLAAAATTGWRGPGRQNPRARASASRSARTAWC